MNIPEITPHEAKSRLDKNNGTVYLDVRTVGEFDQGRPPGALNVPIFMIDPGTGERIMNDRFVEEIEKALPKDREIIVGCRSGGRSARATALLMQAGFTNVTNMAGGFVGGQEHGPDGPRHQPGWSSLSYPVEQGDAGQRSYEALKSK